MPFYTSHLLAGGRDKGVHRMYFMVIALCPANLVMEQKRHKYSGRANFGEKKLSVLNNSAPSSAKCDRHESASCDHTLPIVGICAKL